MSGVQYQEVEDDTSKPTIMFNHNNLQNSTFSSVNVSPKSLFKQTPIERAPPRGLHVKRPDDFKGSHLSSAVVEVDPEAAFMQKLNQLTQGLP